MKDSKSSHLNSFSKTHYINELVKVGYMLKKAIEVNDLQKQKLLSESRSMLMLLLEYLVQNLDAPPAEKELIPIIEEFLGITHEKDREKAKELDEEKEEKLTKDEKERRLRIAIYEVYKILNPNRLAGETHLENFIHNVQTRGIKVALQHDGKEYANKFKKEDLENLASYKESFVKSLSKEGHKGFGHGF